MEYLNLKLKYMDALKLVIINSWLPCGLGIGLAVYQGGLGLEDIDFIVTLLIGLMAAASIVIGSISYLSLTQDGLNFKDWRGRDVFLSWDEELYVEPKKHGGIPFYYFQQKGNSKIYKIPRVLFSYTKTRDFIGSHAPANHPMRGLIS